MKKIIIPFMIALTSSMANAEYLIKVPLEQAQGGSLPNSSISIKSEWIESPTVYGDWIDQGQPYECNNWLPADTTVPMGDPFTQTATDCRQDQTRTAQDQEVETISGIVRDKGEPYTESRAITASSTRQATGTKPNLDCRFNMTEYYYWAEDNTDLVIAWPLYDGPGFVFSERTTSYVYNGVTYIKGVYQHSSSGFDFYQVCKQL